MHKRKDGSLYPVEVNLQLMHEEIPPLFLAIIQNISERKKAEKELRAIHSKLEEEFSKRTLELKDSQVQLMHSEKLSTLGRFAGSVAHEFNNPLFGLINLIEQLGGQLNKEERSKFSKIAKKECWRMADMIKNLQSFYKPSEGVFLSTEINRLIEDVLLIVGKTCVSSRNRN